MKNTKNVKICLITDCGQRLWLTINYFSIRGRKPRKYVDSFYITDNSRWATAVPVKEARKWMREAKYLAAGDGDVIEKSMYMFGGKPITLKAAGLR